MPGETDDGHDKESNGQSQEDKCIFRCPIIIAIVVAALEGLLFLVLKSVVLLDSRLEHPFVETHHDIHGTAMAEVFCVVGNNPTILEAELTTEAESPDATVLFREQNRIFCLDGNLGFVRLG